MTEPEMLRAGDVRVALDNALAPLLAQHAGDDLAALVTMAPLGVAVTARGEGGKRALLGRYRADDAPRLKAAVAAAVAGVLAAQRDQGDLALAAAERFAVRWDPNEGHADVFALAGSELVHIGRIGSGAPTVH